MLQCFNRKGKILLEEESKEIHEKERREGQPRPAWKIMKLKNRISVQKRIRASYGGIFHSKEKRPLNGIGIRNRGLGIFSGVGGFGINNGDLLGKVRMSGCFYIQDYAT